MASIQIYFEGAKFFPSHGAGGRSPRAEGPTAGMGFLGTGAPPVAPARGVGERCKLPSGVWDGTPGNLKFCATADLKIHYRYAL